MDSNNNLVDGTVSTPTPTSSAAPTPPAEPPKPETAPPAHKETIADLALAAKKAKQKKRLKILSIVFVSLLAISVVAGGIYYLINHLPRQIANNTPTETDTNNQPNDEKIEYEYFSESLLKKNEYTIEDINQGFNYSNLSFTGADNVRVKNVITENLVDPDTIKVIVDSITSTVVSISPVTEYEDITAISEECEQDEHCDHDYIEGATTLLTTITTKTGYDYTFYSMTNNGTLVSYKMTDKDKLSETLVRSILIKASLTISDKSADKPYIFDMALRMKYPNDKHPKSYRNVYQIANNAVTLFYVDADTFETAYIYVEQEPIKNVTTTRVSQKPKVDTFTSDNLTYFRYYVGNSPVDVRIRVDGKRSKQITNFEQVQKYIDKIGK